MKLLLVDDDENLLSSLAEFFQVALQLECVIGRNLGDVIKKKSEVLDLNPGKEIIAAILDINLGLNEPSGIEVYRWLRDQGYNRKVAFLTGHAKDHPLVRLVSEIEGASVFEKPMEVSKLIALVESERDARRSG